MTTPWQDAVLADANVLTAACVAVGIIVCLALGLLTARMVF
jgi:hypothetical protein